jgi:hypothetical protein
MDGQAVDGLSFEVVELTEKQLQLIEDNVLEFADVVDDELGGLPSFSTWQHIPVTKESVKTVQEMLKVMEAALAKGEMGN